MAGELLLNLWENVVEKNGFGRCECCEFNDLYFYFWDNVEIIIFCLEIDEKNEVEEFKILNG
jgi:hypothetical protein